MDKKGVIFDLDGTLWDSTKQAVPIWNQVLEKYPECRKVVTLDEFQGYMGKTLDTIAALMLPDQSREKQLEIIHECCRKEAVYLREYGGTLYPNLESVLQKLQKKYSLYIVSNCQDGYIQDFIFAHKLEKYFEDIEMAGRTGKDKGDNIRLVMERNHIDKAVYVGDTMGDYEAAKKAGILFIYAKYGFGKVEEECVQLEAFEKLPGVLEEILLF